MGDVYRVDSPMFTISSLAFPVFRSYDPNMPTWDEPKRLENLRRHGLDFRGCEAVFDGPVVVFEDQRSAYGELRLCAVGWLDGRCVHLTYTEREDDFHAISLREAEKHEIRRYLQEISR